MDSAEPISVTLIIVSDRGAAGVRKDGTAPGLAELLERTGFGTLAEPIVVPDERDVIAAAIRSASRRCAVVLTSGGTGIAPRDVTPEATRDVVSREIPGLAEAMRAASRRNTPFADLSRATAGVWERSIVINLPGSPRGACECLEVVLPTLRHAVALVRGAVGDCQQEIEKARRDSGAEGRTP